MPKIEVDEAEYNQNAQLRATVAKIMADPKRAAQLEGLYKEIEPKAPTPHLDQQKLVNEPVEALRNEIAEFKKTFLAEKEKTEQDAKLAKLNEQLEGEKQALLAKGYTPDGIKKLDEFREKEGILSYKRAAQLFEIDNPPAEPMRPAGVGAFNFIDMPTGDSASQYDKDLQKLVESKGQGDGVTDKIIRDTLTELRGGRR